MGLIRFRATPLTPIHIGDGAMLTPENYLFDAKHSMVRFSARAVLADMTRDQRAGYEKALDGNNLRLAQTTLRNGCDPAVHALYRIAVSARSAGELRSFVDDPDKRRQRDFQVHTMCRAVISGQPLVPGSSLKGALRTAIVNELAHEDLGAARQAVDAERDRRRKGQALETHALRFERRRMERDPLRLLRVADAELPAATGLLDQVLLHKLGKDGLVEASGVQMHFERLLSRADDPSLTGFEIEIELDTLRFSDPRTARAFDRTLDWPLIERAANGFYFGRLTAERRRFLPRADYGVFQSALTGELDPESGLRRPGAGQVLLRVGRFSHFESLSVDDLREGWNIQKKQPITEGASRTLCVTAHGKLSLGWLLLEYDAPGGMGQAGAGSIIALHRRAAPQTSESALARRQRARAEREAADRARVDEQERAASEQAAREAALAALSPAERALQELEERLTTDRAAGRREPGGLLAGRLAEIIRDAGNWDTEERGRIASIAVEIYDFVGWGAKKKRAEKRERIAALRRGDSQ